MKVFIGLFFAVVFSAHASSQYPGEWQLTRLVLQQMYLHKEANVDFYSNILRDWHANLKEKGHENKKVYVFWDESEKAMPWFSGFMKHLMTDLSGIGLSISNRVTNRAHMKGGDKDTDNINSNERFLVFNTSQSSNYGSSSIVLAQTRDWRAITQRFMGTKDVPQAENKCVLPIRVSGYSTVMNYSDPLDYKDFIQDELKIQSLVYLDLLMSITRFCYGLKEDDFDFTLTLSEFKKCLPKIMNNLDAIDEDSTKLFLRRLN